MRLYIGVIAAKELFCSLDGYILHYVHALAAAIIALSGIAFGVFICKDGAHGRHYRLGNYIFRSYELQVPPLSFSLCFYCLAYLRIILCYEIHDLIYHFIFLLINVKLKIKKPHYMRLWKTFRQKSKKAFARSVLWPERFDHGCALANRILHLRHPVKGFSRVPSAFSLIP